MANTQKLSPLEALIGNVLGTRFEDIDRETVDAAKDRIIDVAGCVIGGANAPGNRALVDLSRGLGGKGEATILVHGGRVPMATAAMINCIMARSNDYEPVDTRAGSGFMPSHISGTTVMTALTAGEAGRLSGKELIAALVVGDDVAGRILAAARLVGWDGTGIVNAFGATAIAGRILGLDPVQMRDAFGIVLNQLGGSFQSTQDTATAFKLQQGISARNAIFSTQLAQAGWTGPSEALLGEFGYFRLFAATKPDIDILTRDLGKTYYHEVTFKPYPCCRITHPAISCALALVEEHNPQIEQVERILVYACRRALDSMCGQPFGDARFAHAQAMYSLYYTVATALLRRNVALAHFTEAAMADSHIHDLIRRIQLVELPGDDFLGGRVTLVMIGGAELSASTNAPKGHPDLNPMLKPDLVAKYWSNVRFSQTVTEKNAEHLLGLLETLEELDNVGKIATLMAPAEE